MANGVDESPVCVGGVIRLNSPWKRKGVSISDQMREALDGFEQVISNSENTVDFLMRESDLLFSDNYRTVHARTPISNGATSERLMIRSWIRTS